MSQQVEYYNQFGASYKNAILQCDQPHLWTRDYHRNGAVRQEMTKRVGMQQKFIQKYFDKRYTVFDIGCGFGRQAYLLALMGFCVLGIDPSFAFIEIAEELFASHSFFGTFLCADVMKTRIGNRYRNVLLLDVLEHVIPYRRKRFIQKISAMTAPGGHVILSLPHQDVPEKRTLKKAVKQYFSFFTNREEHPYFIPQKADVESLTRDYYTLVEFEETPETDYYVLERK